MLSDTSIASIIVGLAGSSGCGALIAWATRRADRRIGRVDARSIADKLDNLSEQVDDVCVKLDRDNRRLNELEQSSMRGELFSVTQSRAQHEHQLEVGRMYTSRGYNGAGHVRIRQLERDYADRLEHDDWDYSRPCVKEVS